MVDEPEPRLSEDPDEPEGDSECVDELADAPDGSDDESGLSAHATCWLLATAAPMPRATASPPTRATYAAEFVMLPLLRFAQRYPLLPYDRQTFAKIE